MIQIKKSDSHAAKGPIQIQGKAHLGVISKSRSVNAAGVNPSLLVCHFSSHISFSSILASLVCLKHFAVDGLRNTVVLCLDIIA